MPQEETDLSFADFGGSTRPYTAPTPEAATSNENAPDLSGRGHSVLLEHETRFELATSRWQRVAIVEFIDVYAFTRA